MRSSRPLVIDANILLRAVFGIKVRGILESYEDLAAFYSPDVCFQDARRYIPALAERRNFDTEVGLELLDQISRIVEASTGAFLKSLKSWLVSASRPEIPRTGQ